MASSWCFGQRRVDPLVPRQPAAVRQRLQILLVGERAALLRHQHDAPARSRASPGRGCASLKAITSASECTGASGPSAGQVGVQVGLELVEQHLVLRLVDLLRPSRCPPDRRSPRPASRMSGEARLHDRIDARVEPEEVPRHADPCAAQAAAIERAGRSICVIRADPCPARLASLDRAGRGRPARPAGSPRRPRCAPSGRRCPGCGRWG